jgi:hypothetical protein
VPTTTPTSRIVDPQATDPSNSNTQSLTRAYCTFRVKTKYGWKMKPTDEALARAPRSELASAELEEGKMVSHLRLRFANGQLWEFDIPRSDKKTARAVVAELESSVS